MDSQSITQEFELSIEQAGERLDKALSSLYPDLSRSFFQKLIKDGHILVNGVPKKGNYHVNGGELLSVTIPKAQEIAILPENIPLDILYEDDDVLVVNKPKGMVVHPSAGHYTGTLVNAVMSRQPFRN